MQSVESTGGGCSEGLEAFRFSFKHCSNTNYTHKLSCPIDRIGSTLPLFQVFKIWPGRVSSVFHVKNILRTQSPGAFRLAFVLVLRTTLTTSAFITPCLPGRSRLPYTSHPTDAQYLVQYCCKYEYLNPRSVFKELEGSTPPYFLALKR